MAEADSKQGGLPRWVLWIGLGILALVLLGLCGVLVVTQDLIPGTEPTPIPTLQAGQAEVRIAEPVQDSTVDIAVPLQVSGAGSGLFEGTVVIQAYDGNSNLLAEAATTIDSPDAGTGGSGSWTVTINLLTPTDPNGLILAFSKSPVDGSIAASTSVEVGYVDSSSGQAGLVVVTPNDGETVDISKPVLVAGAGVGLFENNVVVRALDEAGNVLAEQITTTSATEPGGVGQWTVNLTVQVAAGTKGRIVAFSPSSTSTEPDASAGVGVTYGVAPTPTATATEAPTATPVPSTISISLPENGAIVAVGQPFTANGSGSGLFENNVVVRAMDIDGNTLAEQATILNAGELGGSGTWTVDLSVQAEPGTPGHIVAYSPSPKEGQEPTAASIAVTYGQAPASPATLTISFPPHASVVDANAPIEVSGTGSGLFENNVVVRAFDWDGNLLAEQATTLNTSQAGGEGTWSVQLVISVEAPTPGLIIAFSPSASGSNPDAFDGVGVIYNVPVAVLPIAPTPLPTAEQPIVPTVAPTADETAEPTVEATATAGG